MEALRLPLTPRSGVAAPRSSAPRAALRLRSRAAPARASLRLAPARAPRLQLRGRVAAPLRAAGEEDASAGRCALFVAATPPRSAHALSAHAAPAPRSGEAPAEAPPTPAPAPPPQPASTQLEAQPGQPQPLGPSPLGDDAVNFALYSKNANAVTLCLCVRGRRMQRAAGLHDPHVAFGALTACARADSWTRRRPSRPPSSRCAARVTCGTSPSRTSRAQACATVRSRGGTLRAALRSPLTAGAQVSRSAATAAGRQATGGIQTSCFSTRASPCALSRFRDRPLPLLAARIAAFCASDAIPCVFPARRYAPLVAGRDKFADKAFPPGPGRFTGTFDFASAPVRAVHDVIVQRVLRRAVSARAVRLARGGAAGPPRCVKQLPPARCTRVLRLHPAVCACRERLDNL